MKFVHIADVHFDVPFSSLKNKDKLDEKRKIEQRKVFSKVIEFIKKEEIEYLFIAGDLYENEYVKESTIDYINDLFKTIPNTKIFITPGNHDPYIKNSPYDYYEFNSNVKVFKTDRFEKYEDDNLIIYGQAFVDFYKNESYIDLIERSKSDKPEIVITHCDLNGVSDNEGLSYNPISENELKEFSYAAIGHIHKSNLENKNNVIYPGSLVSLGFDELGQHGMIVGTIFEKNVKTEFINLDEREFIEDRKDISDFRTKEDLIENLSSLYYESNQVCKVILEGYRKFSFDVKEIEKIVDNEQIAKIKDETKVTYNLEEISVENTLRGAFVREVMRESDKLFYTEEEILRAIEIGMEAME